jgi:hypothetical protein
MIYLFPFNSFAQQDRSTFSKTSAEAVRRCAIMTFILLLLFRVSFSQTPEGYPVITSVDLPEAVFSSPRSFTGSSLFGYINGGAELYLEYGFSGAVITEIVLKDGKYKTEIYKMNGSEEAFGIFSVSKFRCTGMPDIVEFSCQTKYQLQYCKGPYYISIISSSGTKSDSINMLRLGRIIAGKISEPVIDLSAYIPGISNGALSGCFMVKGRLGIVNGSPDLEDYFKEAEGFSALILISADKTIISVKFRDSATFAGFLALHHWNAADLTGAVIRSDNETVKKKAENHLLIELVK